jgi:hypothetical protein
LRLNAFRTNLDDLGLMLTNDRAIPFGVVVFLMTTSLATTFIVVWSLLASLALGFAQEFESSPDAEITSDQWQQRVQEARRRSEQFVARARTRIPEPLSTDKEEAEASDQRAMMDDKRATFCRSRIRSLPRLQATLPHGGKNLACSDACLQARIPCLHRFACSLCSSV